MNKNPRYLTNPNYFTVEFQVFVNPPLRHLSIMSKLFIIAVLIRVSKTFAFNTVQQ